MEAQRWDTAQALEEGLDQKEGGVGWKDGQRADQESLESQAKRLRISPIGNKEPWRLLWKGLA